MPGAQATTAATRRLDGMAARLQSLWARRGKVLLRLSVAVMSGMAAFRLFKAFRDLFLGLGLGDVTRIFTELVGRWFGGLPVYSYSILAVHPPATYVMLWPFVGWLEMTPARGLWIALNGAAIAWLVFLAVRESGAETRLERAFAALMPLCMYGMFLTVRTGQFGVFLLPMLVAGLLPLARNPPGWSRDPAAAALLLAALVKPTIAAPFIWIALFLPGGTRPVLLVAVGYAALTLFAVSFQPDDLAALLQDWQARSAELALTEGNANLHKLLNTVDLDDWILPASFFVLAAHGWWVYRHREVDPWLLIGATAIVARFWTYHRHYDDIVILLPAIALFRLAKNSPRENDNVAAAALLALTIAGTLIPVRLLSGHRLWSAGLTGGMALLWILLLVFLLKQAREERLRAAGSELRGRKSDRELAV